MAAVFFLLSVLLAPSCFAHKWNFEAAIDSSIKLSCYDKELKPFQEYNKTVYEEIAWLLLGETEPKHRDTLKPPYTLEEEGTILNVGRVTSQTNGVYYCAMKVNGTWHYIKRAINFFERPFSSLWDEYKPKVIRGSIAAASFLVCWILIAIVYMFRYKSPEVSMEIPMDCRTTSFDNSALTPDEDAPTTML